MQKGQKLVEEGEGKVRRYSRVLPVLPTDAASRAYFRNLYELALTATELGKGSGTKLLDADGSGLQECTLDVDWLGMKSNVVAVVVEVLLLNSYPSITYLNRPQWSAQLRPSLSHGRAGRQANGAHWSKP